MTPDRRAIDARDDGGLQDMRLAAQAAEDIGGGFAGVDLVEADAIEIEHLVAAEHDAVMRDRDFQRLGFSQQIGLLGDACAFCAERILQRILVNAGADLFEGEAGRLQHACARLALGGEDQAMFGPITC